MMSIDDYMQNVNQRKNNTHANNQKYLVTRGTSYDAGWEGCEAPLLWVSRQQFTIALNKLKFSISEINMLFNAFDFDIEHKVEVQ